MQRSDCPSCKYRKDRNPKRCGKCLNGGGTLYLHVPNSHFCQKCNGSGAIGEEFDLGRIEKVKCKDCGGSGYK